MSELISRQAAIAEFSCCELTPDGGIDANYAIDFLEQMPSAQPEPQWIPCSERLPEHWVMVLITTIYGDIEFGHYNEEEKTWEWLCESGTNYWGECAGVLAWMPLPEPYKEDNT